MGASLKRKHATYNIRTQNLCELPPIKTMDCGIDSISFKGSFSWNTHEDSIKREKTEAYFQKRTGKWSGARCTCKICQ